MCTLSTEMNRHRYYSTFATVGRRRIYSALFNLLLMTSSPANAALAVNGLLFDSMPAIFGSPWISNIQYQAHLQELVNRPFLCENDEVTLSLSNGDRRDSQRLKEHNDVSSETRPIQDGLPVALLVSRGACSFEEKAREAMKLPNVDFVIVYDDRSRTQLVPMSASDKTETSDHLLFVSHSTGLRKSDRYYLYPFGL